MILIDGVESIDVQEAALLSGRTPETVRRWVWSGRLTSVKQGNKLFVPKAQVPLADGTEGSHRQQPDRPSLRDWAASLESVPRGTPGATASDLVLDDRAARAGG